MLVISKHQFRAPGHCSTPKIMFLLTHEITNLISQAQDESLFVRRLETGPDLLFHFLARLNCKGYKGVFSVNLAMVVRLNLFTGHFAARKI